MNLNLLSTRVVYVVALALILAGCAPALGGSAPGGEAPAAEEPAPEEISPTQEAPGEPAPTQGFISIPTPTMLPSTGGGPAPISPTAQPAIPERRRITLEFPPRIRAGDSDVLRLTLEVDELGNLTPTAVLEGNVVTGEVIEIPNLYETHNVIAEARFDIAGMQVSPPGLSSQPLTQGQSVSFFWSILPDGIGVYRGTVWLYLRFVERVSGEESQRAISAQPVEIEAVNFLGMSANFARTFGVVGSIAGTILGFPFLEDIVKFFFRRRAVK